MTKFTEYLSEVGTKKLNTVSAPVKRKISTDLTKLLKPTYFNKIPLDPIFDVLKKHGLVPLQEDNTEWDGFLVGGVDKTEQVYFTLGWIESKDNRNRYQPVTNTRLALSYYKMPSGKYEIIAYMG